MIVPGPRLTSVFTSRWKALAWAASIMLSAYFFAHEAGSDNNAGDAAQIAAAIAPESANSAAPAPPRSPWAKDAPGN